MIALTAIATLVAVAFLVLCAVYGGGALFYLLACAAGVAAAILIWEER